MPGVPRLVANERHPRRFPGPGRAGRHGPRAARGGAGWRHPARGVRQGRPAAVRVPPRIGRGWRALGALHLPRDRAARSVAIPRRQPHGRALDPDDGLARRRRDRGPHRTPRAAYAGVAGGARTGPAALHRRRGGLPGLRSGAHRRAPAASPRRHARRAGCRHEIGGAVDPLLLYRYLRALNPAPYLFYLALDDFTIVGSSPEVLVRVEGSEVTVRPIAGTCPRGRTREEDEALAQRLLADEKERAEHMMLVDLGRNDVGRVARFGSVRVTDLLAIERYSHVQHLVSEVRGQLRDGYDALDVFKACVPAGTVTGAPKVRVVEIIYELEPERRGPYAGAVGYVGWGAANLDTAIAIRCALVRRDRVVVQAGAGIVADSDPAREFRETEDKAQAVLKALALAKAGG